MSFSAVFASEAGKIIRKRHAPICRLPFDASGQANKRCVPKS